MLDELCEKLLLLPTKPFSFNYYFLGTARCASYTYCMENPERVTYFAATDSRGKRVPFGLKAKDRSRHMYVIGKTGMGKSTFLVNMAVQDIQNGEGMCFIDPHGSAVETLLEYIPEHRIKDVVYFAPFDLDEPIAFNVMEDVGYDKRHLVVSGLMATFKKIWEDAWSARMEYILTNTLLALLEYPGATLLGVNRMYSDKAYRTMVVNNIKDPVVKDFWVKEYAGYTDKFAAEATPAIQNKIGQFTSNPLIRNIIGQPDSSFDIREIMDNKKILLINISKGLVGDTNMRLLGSMLTTRIFLAAMSRAELDPTALKKASPFYFYVDEFQNFANETFAEILSEARKYNLNLIIAHQYVEQMEEQVRAAVFGNVGTTVAFRTGPFDAEVLETVFSPEFLKEDLVNLGAYQIYLSLMIDGVGSRPFSAATLPAIEPPVRTFKEEVIAMSRQQYGNKRAGIEESIFTALASTDGMNGPVEPPKKGGTKAAPKEIPFGERPRVEPTEAQAPVSEKKVPSTQAQQPTREERREPKAPNERNEHPREVRREPKVERPQGGATNERRQVPQQQRTTQPQSKNEPRTSERQNSSSESRAPFAHQGSAPAKTSEDLRAILRSMTAGAKKEQEEKTANAPAPLKTALTDVLKKTEPPHEKASTREVPVEKTRDTLNAGMENKPFEVPEETLRAIFKEQP